MPLIETSTPPEGVPLHGSKLKISGVGTFFVFGLSVLMNSSSPPRPFPLSSSRKGELVSAHASTEKPWALCLADIVVYLRFLVGRHDGLAYEPYYSYRIKLQITGDDLTRECSMDVPLVPPCNPGNVTLALRGGSHQAGSTSTLLRYSTRPYPPVLAPVYHRVGNLFYVYE